MKEDDWERGLIGGEKLMIWRMNWEYECEWVKKRGDILREVEWRKRCMRWWCKVIGGSWVIVRYEYVMVVEDEDRKCVIKLVDWGWVWLS